MCSEIHIIVRPSAHSVCPLPNHLPIPACPYTVLYRLLPFLPTLSLGAIGIAPMRDAIRIAPIREMRLELHIREMQLESHLTYKRHAIGIAPMVFAHVRLKGPKCWQCDQPSNQQETCNQNCTFQLKNYIATTIN